MCPFPLCSNKPHVTEFLLKRGADVNALNRTRCSALHVSVNKQYEGCVRTLLHFGASVNLQVRVTKPLSPFISGLFVCDTFVLWQMFARVIYLRYWFYSCCVDKQFIISMGYACYSITSILSKFIKFCSNLSLYLRWRKLVWSIVDLLSVLSLESTYHLVIAIHYFWTFQSCYNAVIFFHSFLYSCLISRH